MKKLLISMIMILILMTQSYAQNKTDMTLPALGEVNLTLEEYNKLTDLGNKPAIKPEASPISYSIKRADLKLRVTNDSVLGTIQCDGEIFQKGVTRIPLLMGPAILDARQAGKELPLELLGVMQTAILSGPSEFSMMLNVGFPLNIEAGRASFNLPIPAAGSAQLLLEIPGEHTNVKMNPGLITRRSTVNGQTVIEATLAPGQSSNVWWTTREITAPAAPREVRFLSDIKTLASIGEADIRLAVLAGVTIIQGEPAQFEVEIPSGFEMTGVTGATLESEELQSSRLILRVDGPSKRNHQFLISLEKPISATRVDIPILSFKETQRETGEVLVEGAGTMELRATEGGVLKRIDLKEINTYLRSLSHAPLHAAFRYHRQASEPPRLTLDWVRFPDTAVLAAAAQYAEVTTLVTSEGRSLTEVKLTVKNQAQPFLKVGLPAGATILTADVAGEKVKPVLGKDGMRVPLLRLGFRPSTPYLVTFVFVHAGTPFAKKGASELTLPKMDIPINLMQWEVFLPEMYQVKKFAGDAMAVDLLPARFIPNMDTTGRLESSSFVGVPAGNINIQRDGITVNEVRYNSGIVSPTRLNQEMTGEFKMVLTPVDAEMGRGAGQVQIITKSGSSSGIEAASAATGTNNAMDLLSPGRNAGGTPPGNASSQASPASSNVVNLQRRAAGVLPIRVDVPRAGTSYRFVRPLILDEETRMTFQYKSK
jgi:hypothetical protein